MAAVGVDGVGLPNTQPSHPLADYAGDYAEPSYGPLTIPLDGDHLIGKYNDDSSPFDHWHYDVFDAATRDMEDTWLDGRVQFVSDLAGRISAAQIVLEPAVGPVVFKKLPDARLSDPAYLKGLVGTYELAGRPVSISLSGRKLTFLIRGGVPTKLLPCLGGEFVDALQLDARIAFKTDPAGRATGFTIPTPMASTKPNARSRTILSSAWPTAGNAFRSPFCPSPPRRSSEG